MNSLSEYTNKRIQVTSDQVGKVMFFKGTIISFDSTFIKFKEDMLGDILIAISTIKRIEEV